MSALTPEADVVAVATSEILEEAARLRDGEPAEGESLAAHWAEITRDVAVLSRQVERGDLDKPQRYGATARSSAARSAEGAPGARSLRALAAGAAARSSRAARGASRRGVGAARRIAGPRLRSIERRAVDETGRVAEAMATRGHVVVDHARRVATSGGRSGRLDRVAPGGRVLPVAGSQAGATGSDPLAREAISSPHGGADSGVPGATDLATWIIERLERCPPGLVLHVESGDGAFVEALIEAGHGAAGADPAADPRSGDAACAGALESLGAKARGSLGGLVVSGATERVTPGSARALVHLASTRLRSGGIVVLVSAYPPPADAGDPISADLVSRRPLHPVTWCHLLARLGFAEITVFDRAARSGPRPATESTPATPDGASSARDATVGAVYAVAARRP